MTLNKKHCSTSIALLLMTVAAVTFAAAQSPTPTENVIVSFPASGTPGNSPNGTLISDAAGNLYGLNSPDGLGASTIFELSPTAEGGWTAKLIYAFPSDEFPGGGLIRDSSGTFYGALYSGGNRFCSDGFGNYSCGAVYQLTPDGSGGYSEKIIWNASQSEGWRPWSLVADAAGNLYGTTACTGYACGGTVYELQRAGDDWNFTILHVFGIPGHNDGGEPVGPLLFDKAGNIYGATFLGGSGGCGTIFELKKTKTLWKLISLFSFTGGAMGCELSPVIMDRAGNFYGTTLTGGVSAAGGFGVAFEVSPTASGSWQETVLHTFVDSGPGGYETGDSLVMDSAGNLYGTAYQGGTGNAGTVYQLKQSANGKWGEIVLHGFQLNSTDGRYPNGLFVDSKGNLFGTTIDGGSDDVGTVFEIPR